MNSRPPHAQAMATPTSPGKRRFPRDVAMRVAAELCRELQPACERLVVAGSLRRGRESVGDIEILYVPRTEMRVDPANMFERVEASLVDDVLERWERLGAMERRLNSRGAATYGPKNKLMRHVATGLPVDFFATAHACWWNYLVCRTGPSESNIRIAEAARAHGWKWNPYGPGFSRGDEVASMTSEEAVFAFVNLPYKAPDKR